MVIEFVGPPGSGKSTIARSLLPLVESQSNRIIYQKDLEASYQGIYFGLQENIPVINAAVRGLFCLNISVRNIYLILRRWPHLLLNTSFVSSHYWLAKDLILSEFYRANYFQDQNDRCVYWPEEGLIQHSIGAEVFGGGGLDRAKMMYLKSKLFDMIIILAVNVSIDEGFERFWERGVPKSWPGKIKRDKDMVFQLYVLFYELVQRVLSAYADEGAKIIPIDVCGECEDFVKKAEGIYQKLSLFLKSVNNPV